MTQLRAAALPGPAPDIDIVWFSSAADLPEALWAETFPPPLEGRWWYLALERAGIEDQFTFAYAGLKRGGAFIGIAPVFTMDLPLDVIAPDALAGFVRALGRVIPAVRYQRTLFVGSPCADEGTVGLVPGVTLGEVLPALQSALMARAAATKRHMVVWKDMTEQASRALRAFAADAGMFEVPSYPGTRIADPGPSFESYLAKLSGSHRHQLKKKLKRSKAEFELTVEVVRTPSAAVLDELFPLFWATYQKAAMRFERLTPAFFREIALAGPARFVVLRRKESGKAVAFMLYFADEARTINKFLGFDYSLGPNSFLYFRVWEEFVRAATAEGARELQSGQTTYRAKFDLGHEPVPLFNFSRHRNALLHFIYAKVGAGIDWASLDPDLAVYLAAKARKGGKGVSASEGDTGPT